MKPTRGVLILVAVFISLLAVPCAIWISDVAAVSRRSLFLADPPNHMEYVVRWQLVGPFADRSNGSDDEIVAGEVTKDYLRSWDGSEETITMQHAAELCMLKHRCRSYESAGSLVPLYQLFPEDQSSAVYAIGTITCSHAMAVVLDVNVVPGAVWLNGQRVLRFAATEHGGTGLQTRRLLPVQLKVGVNDLMIKTIGKLTQQRDWMLSVGIVSEKESGNIWLERRSGNLLERHLVTAAEAIEIVQPGIPVGAPVHVSLVDINGAVKYEASSTAWPRSVPTNALPEGYYRITLSVGESYATDEVFVGDVAKQINLLMTEPPTTTTPSQRPVQLDSLLQRYKILTSPQYVHPEENSWQRKMVLVARNAVLANQMKDGDAAWTKLPGFHLREYISRSDGSRQPYLIYMPKGVTGSVPLVIEMPYATKPLRPFLESALAIGYPDALEDLAEAADRVGFAVAVIDGRGNAGFSSLGESDALEVLSDLASNLPIDENRIYLYGTCEGGARALKLAEDYPALFAAVGVYGPAIDTNEGWMVKLIGRTQGVFAGLQNLNGIPIHIEEGQFDNVPERGTLDEFMKRLKAVSPRSTLVPLKDGLHGTNAAESRVFPWLREYKGHGTRSDIAAATEDVVSKAEAEMADTNNP